MADVIERAEDDARDLEPGERDKAGRQGPGSRGSEQGQAAGAGPKKKKDHTGLLIALTGAGVIVAYLTYRSIKGGGNSASSSTVNPGSSANNPANYPASSGQVSGYSGDPNASAGLEAMLANLEAQVSTLQAGPSTLPTTPGSPSSGTTAPASPFLYQSGLHYIYDRTTGAIYQIGANGSSYHLNPLQWGEIKQIDPGAWGRTSDIATTPVKKAPATRARTISKPPVKLPVKAS